MAPIALMSVFPLKSLRASFKEKNPYFDARLYELLKEQDFTEDAWTVLCMLRIPTAKDLIERLAETNKDGGLETHFSIIHQEFKDYLTSGAFKDMIKPVSKSPITSIGIVSCADDDMVLIGTNYLDYYVQVESTTCETATERLWHTKLTLKDSSFGQASTFVLRAGDKIVDTQLTHLQIEHLGFEGTQARLDLSSKHMTLMAA